MIYILVCIIIRLLFVNVTFLFRRKTKDIGFPVDNFLNHRIAFLVVENVL